MSLIQRKTAAQTPLAGPHAALRYDSCGTRIQVMPQKSRRPTRSGGQKLIASMRKVAPDQAETAQSQGRTDCLAASTSPDHHFRHDPTVLRATR
jgi:hypothetical protein